MIGIKHSRYVTVLSLSLLLPILTIASPATQAAPSKTTPVAPKKSVLTSKHPIVGRPLQRLAVQREGVYVCQEQRFSCP